MRLSKRQWLVGLVALLVALSWLKPVDQLATDYAEQGFKRAVVTFATARALNAVISVVQGTETTAGVGLSVTMAPGQVLDPINDLVEQFSKLMLFVTVAFGAQIMLTKIAGGFWLSTALTLIAFAWCWNYLRGERPRMILTRVMIALLLVRFIVPVATLTSEAAFAVFMNDEYQESQASIANVSGELHGAIGNRELGSDEPRRWWEIKAKIEDLKEKVNSLVEHTIRLIVVFLMQTVVIPLLVLWVLIRVSALVVRGTGDLHGTEGV